MKTPKTPQVNIPKTTTPLSLAMATSKAELVALGINTNRKTQVLYPTLAYNIWKAEIEACHSGVIVSGASLKELGQCKRIITAFREFFPDSEFQHYIHAVVIDWAGVCSYLNNHHAASVVELPKYPMIWFLTKYCEALMNWHTNVNHAEPVNYVHP